MCLNIEIGSQIFWEPWLYTRISYLIFLETHHYIFPKNCQLSDLILHYHLLFLLSLFFLSSLHLFKWICIATENYDSDFSLSLFGFPPVGQNWLIGMLFVNWLQIGPKVMMVCYEFKFINSTSLVTLVLYFSFFWFHKIGDFLLKNTCFSRFFSNFFEITKKVHEENIGLNYGLNARMEWHSTWYQLNIHTSLVSIEMISYNNANGIAWLRKFKQIYFCKILNCYIQKFKLPIESWEKIWRIITKRQSSQNLHGKNWWHGKNCIMGNIWRYHNKTKTHFATHYTSKLVTL